MKLLFVCKQNRFRSKVAEAYFKKINKNKKILASSGGIFKGIPVAKNVIDVGKKYGMKISKTTNPIREAPLRKTDLVVITANDVPAQLFKSKVKKIITWKIPDCSQKDKIAIEKITRQIIKKVEALSKKLRIAK